MKRSRTGKAVLFIFLVVIVFIAASIGISLMWEKDGETFSWSDLLEHSNRIGVINLEGTITSADDLLKELRKFQRRSSVKAIVIRINSPGGSVAPAQEIYREISKIKKKKPVVASMETVGTSAAYYIASNTDRIVCSAGTITGSIGVIMMLPDLQKVIDKVGVNIKVIKAGKYKDIGSVVRPLTEEEQTILETFAAEIHEQFIMDVAKARKGKIIAIVTEGDTAVRKLADFVIEIPDTEELLVPLLATIPLQLLAYHIAVMRGCSIDQPRNLAKSVTVE